MSLRSSTPHFLAEALGDVGGSGRCPREGFAFSFAVLFCCSGFFDSRDQVANSALKAPCATQLCAAIPVLTGRTFAHYLALFAINLVGNYYFSLFTYGFDKSAQAYLLSLEIFLSCREKNNKNNWF